MKKNAIIASCIIAASIALYFGQHYVGKSGMASAVEQCYSNSSETAPMDWKARADLFEKKYGHKYNEWSLLDRQEAGAIKPRSDDH